MDNPVAQQRSAENAAVLSDFENFYRARETRWVEQHKTSYETTQLINDLRFLDSWIRFQFKGMALIINRAYANFSQNFYAKAVPELMSHGIEPVLQPALTGKGKNAADLRLAMDASSHASSPVPIRSMLLVAGDSDYVPVILRLRSLGIEVVVIGFDGSTATYVKSFASRFYLFEDLLKDDTKKNAETVGQGSVPMSVAYYKMVLEGTDPRMVIVPHSHWLETTDAIYRQVIDGDGVHSLYELDGFVRMDLEYRQLSEMLTSVAPVISQLLTSGCLEDAAEVGSAPTGSTDEAVRKVRLVDGINDAARMRSLTQGTVVKILYDRLRNLGDKRALQTGEAAKLLFGPTPSNAHLQTVKKLISQLTKE